MTDNYNIIIAGSRTFTDYKVLKQCFLNLMLLKDITIKKKPTIICGMAKGADMLGYRLAKEYHLEVIEMPADWDRLGKKAGYVRNEQMAIKVEQLGNGILMAFWDGKSLGTKHMINLAKKHHLDVLKYNFKGEPIK